MIFTIVMTTPLYRVPPYFFQNLYEILMIFEEIFIIFVKIIGIISKKKSSP